MLFQLKYIHDGIVQLSEHHKVDGKAGGTVLGGRIAREPGQSVVLLQNKPAGEKTHVRGTRRGRGEAGSISEHSTCQREARVILALAPCFPVVLFLMHALHLALHYWPQVESHVLSV